MPVFNRLYHPSIVKFDPNQLLINGPVIAIEISIPSALANFYTTHKLPIPAPKIGFGLIDTGATRTCVDQSVISSLGVSPVGTATSGTASGPSTHNLYPTHVRFIEENIDIDFNQCMGVNLTGQNAMGQPLIALIGRDILSNFLLVYNGPAGMFTLST